MSFSVTWKCDSCGNEATVPEPSYHMPPGWFDVESARKHSTACSAECIQKLIETAVREYIAMTKDGFSISVTRQEAT